MALSVLPMLKVGGMQLFKAEAFDAPEKILPRATQISGIMTLIFIGLTAICAILYHVAGMELDDAIMHAMTTVATGGFSSKDASMAISTVRRSTGSWSSSCASVRCPSCSTSRRCKANRARSCAIPRCAPFLSAAGRLHADHLAVPAPHGRA
ncbi:potassium transporter TrkG [Breoghania sp.]|uniref:potassium transporter TrkG n=1 Tax=Breoghania sp. TaxID=2065378 RepID=UPI002601B3AA|nr:potassium transporter TrkG [Breoghania sp.]MDJ0932921.1 potassium transporter TrkG [Breoghania sp.]